MLHPLPPLATAHLFPVLDQLLLGVLASLTPAQWEQPTLAPQWRVRDVALHLLDGNLRALSMLRDGYFGQQPAGFSYGEIVEFLNQLNADWVRAGQRLSPGVIRWLLEISGPEYNRYLASLDPEAPATFSVGWAGETESANWFHVARDYTEKWHHQQQIRQAVGQEQPLLSRELYHPFLATCLRALPHHYRGVAAEAGQVVGFTITGPAHDTWYLRRGAEGWELSQNYAGPLAASVTIDGAVAWRLFTKSLPRNLAAAHIHFDGETRLGEPVFDLLTVMA
ncbi:maleylpyruvate isomerase N-terminal domain-containing protein [Hymenobacter cellulosilyticus]|uniref:Maleylpyruvate isomerase N-terminal domain-containing protein n=1 Tax=Hymenobacter cellulosilyticus TaxID=2932248 RepID=A0A8T9Q4N8_9BACT|nr:maleylpyruvate isomerase N-terminal domain-containing protein [Hymenobacter cellulosilyticus]UOQ70858.1 maleylpyruvate isomerase N-terminal domain-containing protein [Hymenobacter cellulosilyticus]